MSHADAAVIYSPRSLIDEGIRTASLATIVEELHTLQRRVILKDEKRRGCQVDSIILYSQNLKVKRKNPIHIKDQTYLCNKISARQNLAIFNPFALIVLIASRKALVLVSVFVDVMPNRLRTLRRLSKSEASFKRQWARHAAFIKSSSKQVLICASSIPANSK